jgi:uncharacterized protein YndB with AHSA1/START domain
LSESVLIEPVSMSITVPIPAERAFALFTTELGSWWPLRTHSIGEERTVTCGVEPRVGGAVYEELNDGTRHEWGRVIVWEPPDRVALTWHPGMAPSDAQQVEISFTRESDTTTRVDLSHYGWEVLGEQAAEVRAGYANGWKTVFGELYAGAARKAAGAEVNS